MQAVQRKTNKKTKIYKINKNIKRGVGELPETESTAAKKKISMFGKAGIWKHLSGVMGYVLGTIWLDNSKKNKQKGKQ